MTGRHFCRFSETNLRFTSHPHGLAELEIGIFFGDVQHMGDIRTGMVEC